MGEFVAQATDKLTSRKFWLVMLSLLTTTALLLVDKITPEVWEGVMEWLVSAYILGNVAVKSKLVSGGNGNGN